MSKVNFAAHREGDVMTIDNATIEFDLADLLASDVELVSWSGQTATGRVEYNDRLRLLPPFRDLLAYAPSLPLINAWLTAAAALPAPLTLNQAKIVKTNVITDICRSKQRLPYRSGSYDWETDDEAIIQMALAMLPLALETVSADSYLVAQINSRFQDYIAYYFTRVNAEVNEKVAPDKNAAHSVCYTYVGGSYPFGTAVGGGNTVGSAHISQTRSVAWPGFSGYPIAAVRPIALPNSGYVPPIADATSGLPPSVPWESTNVFESHLLTIDEACELMTAISKRNINLSKTKVRKIKDINALTTIESVIAYDLAEGW